MQYLPLFPALLREAFTTLPQPVQSVHSGSSGRWSGRATVQRGSHPLMRMAAAIAGLPSSQRDVPTVVTIDAGRGREIWTRQFGTAAAMRSTLSARRGQLVEQLGPVAMQFQVVARDGAMHWELRRIAFLGVPLPRRCFQVQARADSSGWAYRFLVAVRVVGVGELIRYEGELEVPGQG